MGAFGIPVRHACRLPSPSQSACASCATSPTGGGKSTPVGGGQEVVRQTCSQLCLTVQFTIIDARTLGSPRGGAGETPVRAARLRGELSGTPETKGTTGTFFRYGTKGTLGTIGTILTAGTKRTIGTFLTVGTVETIGTKETMETIGTVGTNGVSFPSFPIAKTFQTFLSFQTFRGAGAPAGRVGVDKRTKPAIFNLSSNAMRESARRCGPLQRAGPGESRQGLAACCRSRAGQVRGQGRRRWPGSLPRMAPRYRGVKGRPPGRRAQYGWYRGFWIMTAVHGGSVGRLFLSPPDSGGIQ